MTSPEDRYKQEETAFYLATGEVIREWTELEEMLIFHLSALLNTDTFRAQVVWNSMTTGRPRLRLLLRLSETFLLQEAADTFREFMNRVGNIAKNRNLLAHAHGHLGERPNTIAFVWDDEDDELGFNFLGNQTVQIRNIQDWARDIVRVRNDLMNFLPRLRASVCASPKMHRVQPGGRTSKPGQAPSESTSEAPAFIYLT